MGINACAVALLTAGSTNAVFMLRAARAAFLRYTRVTNELFHLPLDTESAPADADLGVVSSCSTSRAAITSVLQG